MQPPVTARCYVAAREILWWFGVTALLTVAYAVSGWLGLLLAIPPGYATAVWPPAGIALAVILVYGNRISPGIWFGSFILNFLMSLRGTPTAHMGLLLAVSASIGVGATLQALAAAFLVKRWAQYPNPLVNLWQIVRFELFSGPVSCLIAASWGVATLRIAGLIGPSEWLFSWWTWWVGDTIAVMLLAPATILILRNEQSRLRQLSVALPIAAMFALTVVAFTWVCRWERDRNQMEFQQRANVLAVRMQQSFDNYQDALNAIERLFNSSTAVTAPEFKTFVLPFLDRNPGLLACSWNSYLRGGERTAFVSEMSLELGRQCEIQEVDFDNHILPAPERDEYVVVRYVEPQPENAQILGLNALALPDRSRAIHQAKVTGKTSAVSSVVLLQHNRRRDGVLIFQPVYRSVGPLEAGKKQPQTLQGFVVGVLLLNEAIQASLCSVPRSDIVIEITENRAGTWVPIYDSQNYERRSTEYGRARVHRTDYVVPYGLADRQWRFHFWPTREYVAAHRTWGPWMVTTGGVLFSSLLGAFLLVVTGQSACTEQLVNARTAELAKAQAQLAGRAEELARSNRELEQFAYVASHDLREPLRMVYSFCTLLRDRYLDQLDERAEKYIRYAVEGATRMQALVDDLLEYSRVGRSSERMESVDLHEALTKALDNLKIAIQERSAIIEVSPLPVVRGDALRLTQVLQNLLGNALKFCSAEIPRIRIFATASGQQWRISVQDNGIGIDPQYFDRVFVVFQRLHTQAEYPGTGVGLALCKRILDLHRGRIWLESELGQGTTVHFTLTAASAADHFESGV